MTIAIEWQKPGMCILLKVTRKQKGETPNKLLLQNASNYLLMFVIHTCCSSYLLLCYKLYQNLVHSNNKPFIISHNFMSHEIWKGVSWVILLFNILVTELV